MPTTVTIEAAQAGLSALIERAVAGEEVVISRAGEPVARLVAVEPPRADMRGSGDAGIDPLSEDIRRVFASRYRE